MFRKRLALICLFGLVSAGSVHAAPERAPMPRVVAENVLPKQKSEPLPKPGCALKLLDSNLSVYGPSLALAAQINNLQGRECKIIVYFSDSQGTPISDRESLSPLCRIEFVPEEATHQFDRLHFFLPKERVAELYGADAKTIYIGCEIVYEEKGKLVGFSHLIPVNLKKKPTAPISPRNVQ